MFLSIYIPFFLKVKLHKFKNISFDSNHLFINKKKFNYSEIQKIEISYLKPSIVVLATSKKVFFLISLEDYSNQKKINKLRDFISNDKIEIR